MKRPRRLWWCAGAFFCVLVVLAWWLVAEPAKPSVSVAVVGFTNRPVAKRVRGVSSEVVCMLEVSNRSSMMLELWASLDSEVVDPGPLVGSMPSWVIGIPRSQVTNAPEEAVQLELKMVQNISRPYWVSVTYEPLTPSAYLWRWVSRSSSFTLHKLAAQVLPARVVRHHRIGPFTNYPPLEMFTNTTWGLMEASRRRVEAMNSLPTNMTAWSGMVQSNLLFLATNKPPAGENPRGGLQRLEF